jgi:hypothetical protein
MNTYPRVYLTYHGDGNVGIGTPPQVASAPLGEPVEHLRVSMKDYFAGEATWRTPDDDPPPLGVKILLLNPGGVCVIGTWSELRRY